MAIQKNPFTLGVASGDPWPDSVVLWTRLAPEPYEANSGMPAEPVTVEWEVSRQPDLTEPVARGSAVADPAFHHAVHVEAGGLQPYQRYYYRFRTGLWTSPTGRTRTAPARDATVDRMRFGMVSCARYDHGYFTVLRHLAQHDDVDVVFHLGDYLYEYPVDSVGGSRQYTGTILPAHFAKETMTLEDYRLRYSLHHTDPDLQAAHAAHPWVVTWDDHETENNYAGAISEDGVPTEEFLLRRAAAYRAFYENLPLRPAQRPQGPDAQLYRRLHYGRLAQFDVLDTRQYRDDQANGDGWQVPTPESEEPARTMTGAAQESWLLDGWRQGGAVWNVLAQQVVFARRHNRLQGPFPVSMDAWDGYPAARRRLVDGLRAIGPRNLVVLTGDVHVHYALDLKENYDDPASRAFGVELVTSSVSTGQDGQQQPPNWEQMLSANPHMRFYNGLRGYVLVTLDQRSLRAEYRTVSHVTSPTGTVATAAVFVSRAGDPGLVVE